MLTINRLNIDLKDVSPHLQLVRGSGYFYFVFDDGNKFETEMVYVRTLNTLPHETWIKYAKSAIVDNAWIK